MFHDCFLYREKWFTCACTYIYDNNVQCNYFTISARLWYIKMFQTPSPIQRKKNALWIAQTNQMKESSRHKRIFYFVDFVFLSNYIQIRDTQYVLCVFVCCFCCDCARAMPPIHTMIVLKLYSCATTTRFFFFHFFMRRRLIAQTSNIFHFNYNK